MREVGGGASLHYAMLGGACGGGGLFSRVRLAAEFSRDFRYNNQKNEEGGALFLIS